MDGTDLTTRWKGINLVFGVLVFLIPVENQPFHMAHESNSDSNMMGYSLIESLHGLSMQPWIRQGLEHHMMVSTGIHHLQKGNGSYSTCLCYRVNICNQNLAKSLSVVV